MNELAKLIQALKGAGEGTEELDQLVLNYVSPGGWMVCGCRPFTRG